MTDYSFWAMVIATGCLVVECVNLGILAYIIRWTGNAGASIVNKISQSLNLKQGKTSIGDTIKGIVDKVSSPAKGDEEPIDTPWGTYTVSEIRNFAGSLKGKAKKGEIELPGGDMDLLTKIATGKDVGIVDALPLLKQMFTTPAQGQGNGTPATHGTNWDS